MSSTDVGYNEGKQAITQHFLKRILETGCYETVGKYPYHIIAIHNYSKRHLFRILPKKECLDRLIKRGYYRNNKSLGKANDFERAFMGYETPFKASVDRIKS